MASRRAHFIYGPDGRIHLKADYSQDFVARIKMDVPSSSREWDPGRKLWIIEHDYQDEMENVLDECNYEVTDATGGRHNAKKKAATKQATGVTMAPACYAPVPSDMPRELLEAFASLDLWWSAPMLTAEAAFKSLARQLHPDVGGDADEFIKINDAIVVIRRYLS